MQGINADHPCNKTGTLYSLPGDPGSGCGNDMKWVKMDDGGQKGLEWINGGYG